MLKRIIVMLLITGFAFTGCTKSDSPMPLTKENIIKYLKAMAEAGNGMSAKEADEAQKNEAVRAEAMKKMLVQPLEKMGYNYDKTIGAAARKIVDRDYPVGDSEFQMALIGLLQVPGQMKDFLLKYNIITAETKDLLVKAGQ